MELSSYHAIVACVASGTGIALVPNSVLATVRCADNISVHPLNRRHYRVATCLVNRKGESSPALNALKTELGKLKNGSGR